MPFWTKKEQSQRVKIFFVTDLHGSDPTFRKYINSAKFYEVDHLIMGGDVTGKFLVPIIDAGNDHYRATLQGTPVSLQGQAELSDFIKKVGKLGSYTVITRESEYQHLLTNPDEVQNLHLQKAKERLSAWIEFANERLKGTKARCYLTGGNDDSEEIVDQLHREASEYVIPCEDTVMDIGEDGHTMVSFGYSNPTPWNTPREMNEEDLTGLISKKLSGISDFSRVIFNFHVPPIDSQLDTCPVLDTSTSPPTVVTSGGEPVMFGAGSMAVRQAIQIHQPLLGLHGHIHESRNVVKIGRTVAVNPGSEYGEGLLRGILITLKGDEVESTQMTSG